MKQLNFYRNDSKERDFLGSLEITGLNKLLFRVKKKVCQVKSGRYAVLVLSLFVFFTTTSCLDEYFVVGNRSPVTETRYADNFDKIASGGEFIVNVVSGDEFSVQVTAESNLLNYIETDVVDHTLKIRTWSLYNLRNHEPMIIDIVCPELNGLRVSGSGVISADHFTCDSFDTHVSGSGEIIADIDAVKVDAHVSGSGKITLIGNCSETDFDISGSGKIHSYDLLQEYCDAKISGSGAMYVNVSDLLDVTISGSGKVYYINYPAIHTKISGSGEVIDRN